MPGAHISALWTGWWDRKKPCKYNVVTFLLKTLLCIHFLSCPEQRTAESVDPPLRSTIIAYLLTEMLEPVVLRFTICGRAKGYATKPLSLTAPPPTAPQVLLLSVCLWRVAQLGIAGDLEPALNLRWKLFVFVEQKSTDLVSRRFSQELELGSFLGS